MDYVYTLPEELQIMQKISIGNSSYFLHEKDIYKEIEYDFTDGQLRALHMNKDEFFNHLAENSPSIDDKVVKDMMGGLKMSEEGISEKLKDAILSKHPDYEYVKLDGTKYIILRDKEDKMNFGANIARADRKRDGYVWNLDYHGLLDLNRTRYIPYSRSDKIDDVHFENETP